MGTAQRSRLELSVRTGLSHTRPSGVPHTAVPQIPPGAVNPPLPRQPPARSRSEAVGRWERSSGQQKITLPGDFAAPPAQHSTDRAPIPFGDGMQRPGCGTGLSRGNAGAQRFPQPAPPRHRGRARGLLLPKGLRDGKENGSTPSLSVIFSFSKVSRGHGRVSQRFPSAGSPLVGGAPRSSVTQSPERQERLSHPSNPQTSRAPDHRATADQSTAQTERTEPVRDRNWVGKAEPPPIAGAATADPRRAAVGDPPLGDAGQRQPPPPSALFLS